MHQRISAVAQKKNPHRVVLNTLLQISPGVRKNEYLLETENKQKRHLEFIFPLRGFYGRACVQAQGTFFRRQQPS